MSRVLFRRATLIVPALLTLLAAAVLWYDALVNESHSARSMALAACATAAGTMLFLFVLRAK